MSPELKSFFAMYHSLSHAPISEVMEMLLDSLEIKTEEDIDNKLSLDKRGFISKDTLDMRARLLYYIACDNAIKRIMNAHDDSSKLFFHDSRHIGGKTKYLDTYVTLFPGRYVAYTSDLYLHQKVGVQGTETELTLGAALGTDLLRQYLRHKQFIDDGLLYLFPKSVFQIDDEYVSVPNCTEYKNTLYIDRVSDRLEIIPKTDYTSLVVELPWLRNAHVEDFIELREKYKIEYERFQIKTDELLLKAQEGETIESLLAKEYNEASLEIRNIVTNRKSALKRKGKEVLLGTICTIIPIILDKAGVSLFDPKIFSSVIGGSTVYNSIKDFLASGHAERDNPYWILYKWDQISNS